MPTNIKPLKDRKTFIHYLNSTKNNDMNLVEFYLSQLQTEQYNEIPVNLDDDVDYRTIIRYSNIDFEFSYAKYNNEYYLILFPDEIDEYCDGFLEDMLYEELNRIPADLKQYFDVKKWRNDMKKKGAGKILSCDGMEIKYEYDGITIHIFRQKDLKD